MNRLFWISLWIFVWNAQSAAQILLNQPNKPVFVAYSWTAQALKGKVKIKKAYQEEKLQEETYFNEQGYVTKIVRYNPKNGKLQSTYTYKYDANNRLLGSSGTDGASHKVVYDADFKVKEEVLFNKKKQVWRTVYNYNANGQVVSDYTYMEGELFSGNRYRYNEKGQIVHYSMDICSNEDCMMLDSLNYIYNELGDMIEQMSYEMVKLKMEFKYDAQNRLVEAIRRALPLWESDDYVDKTQYVYDAQGNLIEIRYEDNTDNGWTIEQYRYDDQGNLIYAHVKEGKAQEVLKKEIKTYLYEYYK